MITIARINVKITNKIQSPQNISRITRVADLLIKFCPLERISLPLKEIFGEFLIALSNPELKRQVENLSLSMFFHCIT